MRFFLAVVLLLLLATPGHSAPECGRLHDCVACASACHWCPRDNQCHNPSFVNFVDPCWFHGGDIKKVENCADQPDPHPFPPPSPPAHSAFAKDVLGYLFKKLNITDVNASACISDVGHSEVKFQDFAIDLKSKKYKSAVEELGRGISALANSVTTCGVPEVSQKLESLAQAIKWANISTHTLGLYVKVIVGASDMWKDLETVEQAVVNRDSNSIGDTLGKLLDDWTSIEGGCKEGESVCQVIDGLFRVIAVTAKEVKPCEAALTPAIHDFIVGGKMLLSAVNVGVHWRHWPPMDCNIDPMSCHIKAVGLKNATLKIAAGLEAMAKATMSDACGLKHIADAIGNLSPKLAAAVVNISNSAEVKIMVGSANVYNELYTIAQDLEKKDYTGVGGQLGMLLAQLKTSTCETEMCIVVEGLLASLQVGFTDLDACSADLDKSWIKMQMLLSSLKNEHWKQALLDLGGVIYDIADSVKKCGVTNLGSILQTTASKLHLDSLAVDIGVSVQFLAKGTDITPDIQKIIVDANAKQWGKLGTDLGVLSTWITSTDCHAFTCRILEGILKEADMVLSDLKPCESTLRVAETDFTAGAVLWGKNQPKSALTYWASGLNQVAKAVAACGLPSALGYIEQEANALGLGNVTAIGSAVSIIVHGSDIYEEMFAAWQAFSQQDYRTAGEQLHKAVFALFKWTTGHLCTTDACYVFSGILQYVEDLAKDIKKCGADFKDMMASFHSAFEVLVQYNSTDGKGIGGFVRNKTAIEAGIGLIGKGIGDLPKILGDCHLQDLETILQSLAVKLKVAPHVVMFEDMLKILIEGVPIEQEIANAMEDVQSRNWPGVGYNLIKLIKTLIASKSSDSEDAIVVV